MPLSAQRSLLGLNAHTISVRRDCFSKGSQVTPSAFHTDATVKASWHQGVTYVEHCCRRTPGISICSPRQSPPAWESLHISTGLTSNITHTLFTISSHSVCLTFWDNLKDAQEKSQGLRLQGWHHNTGCLRLETVHSPESCWRPPRFQLVWSTLICFLEP